MAEYAYIRVSSKDQNIARQVEAMLSIGITKKQMYIDKQSGKDFNRKIVLDEIMMKYWMNGVI